jgi:O-antigen/teichoic acid export membrane protein
MQVSRTMASTGQRTSLTTDTVAVSVGTVARAASQALLLVVVARTLGPAAYASLTAIFSIALVMAVMSAAGTHVLLVKNVAAGQRTLRDAWGSALGCLALTSAPLLVLATLLALALAPERTGALAIAAICFAEVVLSPWCVVSAATFHACSAMRAFAVISVVPSVLRLAASVVLLGTAGEEQTDALQQWACLYLIASLAAALLCQAAAHHSHGRARVPSLQVMVRDIQVAWPFAAGAVAQSAYSAVDKVLVARLCEGSVAGAYALAIRLVELATVPAWSAAAVLAPRLFSAEGSRVPAAQHTHHAFTRVVGPALLLSVAMAISTPLIPLVFGHTYQEATIIASMLSVMPGVIAVRIFLQLRLNTTGMQRHAAVCLLVGTAISASLNTLLLPSMAARGAVIALIAAELSMVACMKGSIVWREWRQHG